MTGQELVTRALPLLRQAGVADPVGDARILLAYALGVPRGRLTLMIQDVMPTEVCDRFHDAIARRVRREPVSHILGSRIFYGRSFEVGPQVLDPRPETETLVEVALAQPFDTVLDLGTGSGCILATLLAEFPKAKGVGTDVSLAALETADRNLRTLGLIADLVQSDWYGQVTGSFDLIVSNPPYIAVDELPFLQDELRYEPQLALTDGGDGLSCYRQIAVGARAFLNPGGRILVEIGQGQAKDVMAIFSAAGFINVRAVPDLGEVDRVICANSPENPLKLG